MEPMPHTVARRDPTSDHWEMFHKRYQDLMDKVNRIVQDNNTVNAQQNFSPATSLSTGATPHMSNQYVLQTASALIFNEAEQDYQPITILLDSGAQRSFIKTGSLHSSRKLQYLPVHTKERLTSTTKTAQLSEADRKLIRSLRVTIAQSDLTSSELSPDLLIGQDLLNTVLDHNASTLRLPSGLILTSTIFGYTISGTSEAVLRSKETEATYSSLVVATPAVTSARDIKRDIKHLYELESLGLNTKDDSNEAEMIKDQIHGRLP
ncbi:hypothetical protein OESDEN_03711 [Oesophagostomum dentatum]|uniref:Peptidase A2 domain-containing protein n=1 Tax=Oesophagostomum dentatum TaxID=61180 RepID=A0A0B1TKH6_OESDE|nr:hypothetical protein OESDEN_03711 [Oesophagostomum dentatum]